MIKSRFSGKILNLSYLAIPVIFAIVAIFMFFVIYFWPRTQENLQRDYEEVFATPFKDVHIIDYLNEHAGHGCRFKLELTSQSPLRLKNPEAFEEMPISTYEVNSGYVKGGFEKSHPWVTTILYRKQASPGQEPGPVSLYFDQAKTRCEADASKAFGIWPTKANGQPFSVSNASTIELSRVDESYIAYSKAMDHQKIFIEYPGSHNIAVSVKKLDLGLASSNLYTVLLGYLRELEAYKGKDWRVKDKLLDLEMPNGVINDAQVDTLEKLGEEVKNYNSHLPADTVPIRLKVTVILMGTDCRFLLKHP